MDIYSGLRSFFILSKIFGFLPFSLRKKSSKFEFIIDPVWCCYSIFVMKTLIFAFIFPLWISKRTDLVEEVWRLISSFGIFMNIIQFISEISKFKLKIKLFKQFKNLDKKALRCGIFMFDDEDQTKVKIMTVVPIILIAFHTLVVSVLQLLYYDISDKINYLNLVLGVSQLFAQFFSVQVLVFSWLLRKRFDQLRIYLEASLLIRSIGLKNDKIHKFSELFSMSCEIIKTFNEIFSLNLAFTLLHVMIQEIFTCYGVLRNIYRTNFYSLINNISWLVPQIVVKYIICYAGELVKSSCESNQNLLVKKIIASNDENFKEELRHLYFELEKQNKDIKNIFFTINFKLFLVVS